MMANEKIRILISGAGALESVENLVASETYTFDSDSFILDTDVGLFSNRNTRPAKITAGRERIVYH